MVWEAVFERFHAMREATDRRKQKLKAAQDRGRELLAEARRG